MKTKKTRYIFATIAFFVMSGCATKSPEPDPVAMATIEFRQQMMDVANRSVNYLNDSKRLIVSSDPETEWVNNVSEQSPLNQRANLGFVNGVWVGSFEQLLHDVSERSGYKYIDLLRDKRTSSYQVSIPAENITLMELLYVAYTNVPNSQIDLIIREDSKTIILRNKCDYGDACDGLRKLSNGTPRAPS
ncbi:hypothetical protein [Marinomonas sp. 2405UD68-3]|uniref:hypothetical protein n=1 Tax=Marinomonas sp. 2405UD68-3 TaxID=3391835 RepID=UPI0039C8C57E